MRWPAMGWERSGRELGPVMGWDRSWVVAVGGAGTGGGRWGSWLELVAVGRLPVRDVCRRVHAVSERYGESWVLPVQ
jgi:hypothetical protein